MMMPGMPPIGAMPPQGMAPMGPPPFDPMMMGGIDPSMGMDPLMG